MNRFSKNKPIMAMPIASLPAMPIANPTTVPNPSRLV